MSRSDWHKFSKTIGLTSAAFFLLALLYVVGFYAGNVSGFYEGQAERTASQYPTDTQRIIDGCFNLPTRTATGECISEAHAASQESQRAEYDLKAQRDMSDWAWWVMVIGALQFFATIATLGFVKLTLDATLEAVKDTCNATQAMVRQNELVEQAQRPWLTIAVRITKAKKTKTGILLRYQATVTNIGGMVADRCAVRGGFIEQKGERKGNADLKIQGHRREAEALARLTKEGPRMPYPILPGETKTIECEIEAHGDLPVYKLGDGVYHTTYQVFICARYHLPGQDTLRATDRAFSINYMTDVNDPFAPDGIPVPLPDDLSAESVILRPAGHNKTT